MSLQSLALAMLVLAPTVLQAQSNNVLGLPAVPQTPAAPTAASTAAASAARRATSATPAPLPALNPSTLADAEVKSALSGNISLASFYQEGLITVRVSTAKTFVGSAPRAQALQAARLVQRDVRLACGKLCKPGPMPAPTIEANNTLRFDLVISGYAGTLSTADMVNLVNAKAIGPGGKVVAVPAAASAPTATAAHSPNSPSSPSSPSAATAAPPAGPASAPLPGASAPP